MAVGRELPEDVLADVLRRLPQRSLARSRCVCRAWREIVDAHRLLRVDLLPRSVRGIFIEYGSIYMPRFFSRPTTGPAISGDLDFVHGFSTAEGHCNGLLLCTAEDDHDYVANPATRQWARLPRRPTLRMGKAFYQSACLVYDPVLSPHYEVFLIPIRNEHETRKDPEILQSEWPPSSYALQVFSSLTGRWEERLVVREGCAAGDIAVMKICCNCLLARSNLLVLRR